MLRFLRPLLQRLFTENRFSKYLLYAMGGIMLLSKAILAASQVINRYKHRNIQERI